MQSHQEDVAASGCQQNNTSKLGRLDLLRQMVVDLTPPYSQCYGAVSYEEVKGLPGTGVQLLLCRRNMMYAVTSYHICHLLGVQYDAFDITSWAMAIGGKLPMIAYQPMTAIPGQFMGHNQGLVDLNYGAPVFPVHKGEGIPFHRDIFI